MKTIRLGVSLVATFAVAFVLLAHRSPDASTLEGAGAGVVYVYFPSLCARAGDASDCHEISHPGRPAFDTMAACSAYADIALRQVHDPRVMASCQKLHEG